MAVLERIGRGALFSAEPLNQLGQSNLVIVVLSANTCTRLAA